MSLQSRSKERSIVRRHRGRRYWDGREIVRR
jgi:hypothetical protein